MLYIWQNLVVDNLWVGWFLVIPLVYALWLEKAGLLGDEGRSKNWEVWLFMGIVLLVFIFAHD